MLAYRVYCFKSYRYKVNILKYFYNINNSRISFTIEFFCSFQVFWYKIIPKLKVKTALKTDKRVLLIGEVINGIKVIKMYAWENYFERLVCLVRKREIDEMLMTFYIRGINFAMSVFTDRTSLFCTLAVYVWLGNEVTADRMFSTIGYFVYLRLAVFKYYPDAVYYASALKVTFDRTEVSLLKLQYIDLNKNFYKQK